MRYLILGAALTLLPVLPSHAQSVPQPADEIVAMRKAMMDLQGGVLAAMKVGIEGKTSVKGFADGAKALTASGKLIPSLFPTGTEKAGNTKAKAAIWSDSATFSKDSQDLVEAAEKLSTLAEADDKDGFAKQFAAVGQTCGACHRAFKER